MQHSGELSREGSRVLPVVLPALASSNSSFSGLHDGGQALSSPSKPAGKRAVSSFLKGLFSKSPSDAETHAPAVDNRAHSTTQSSKSSSTMTAASRTASSIMAHRDAPSSPKGRVSSARTTDSASTTPITQGSAGPPSKAVGGSPLSAPGPSSPKAVPPKPNTVLLAVAPVLPPNMSRPTWCMRDYAIVEKMYTGYASTVYKAWCKASGETVCLKAYNMSNLCELNRYQIYREVKLHSNLQHENIVTLFAAFKEGDQVVLVQEYAESGDLFMLLHRYGGKLPEKTAVELVLHPFLCVLKYLHANAIVHRDIKPENVLFTRTMQLKLCDFGLAIDLREERAVTRAGTLEYMAPEVLNCPFKNKPQENKDQTQLQYTLTVDTWAVGVLTYELLVGFPPFNDKQRAAIEHKIRQDTPRFPSTMTELVRNFILKTLQKDALERPTIHELLTHPWIRGHRRNASTRNLQANVDAASAAIKSPDSNRNEFAIPSKAALAASSSEQRTDTGDLMMQPLPSYASFTTGANRPKFMQSTLSPTDVTSAAKVKKGGSAMQPQAAGMSFSTAQNPKLQALRGHVGYGGP